jgi:hypothetical protein
MTSVGTGARAALVVGAALVLGGCYCARFEALKAAPDTN